MCVACDDWIQLWTTFGHRPIEHAPVQQIVVSTMHSGPCDIWRIFLLHVFPHERLVQESPDISIFCKRCSVSVPTAQLV